ncbi:MAG: collagen-like protein [Patiriisocius sp.]|uniref:collagen-like protein n=1 Tax=Patiriisocius sp. TaxID=2822396 RepID=UPI003EF5BB0C
MKHLFLFLGITASLLFSSCEGDPVPPGEPGINILGQVFETTLNFNLDTGNNQYVSQIINYPFEVFESDAILVYRLQAVVPLGDGTPADVWTQLPQNVFFNDGTGDIFQYNFNHTFLDVQMTIEGNFDLTNIGSENINNQTFRIVAVPAEFADANLSMDDLLRQIEIDASEIEHISN